MGDSGSAARTPAAIGGVAARLTRGGGWTRGVAGWEGRAGIAMRGPMPTRGSLGFAMPAIVPDPIRDSKERSLTADAGARLSAVGTGP